MGGFGIGIGFGIVYGLLVFVFGLCSYKVLFRRDERREATKRAKLKLPPGSMGLPFIGETLQLYSQDPNVFFTSKQKRFN